MSKYDKDVQDVYAVKQLGDSIGYGHLMAIAHELWARHLESKGLPRTGAHCTVGYPMVKEQYQAEALNDRIYTIIVGKALADRKTENCSEKPNNCEDEPDCDKCIWSVCNYNKVDWDADTPQTFEKPPKCLGCLYSDLDKAFHPCASCVDFGKYVGEVSGKDEPQTDCPWK